MDEDLPEKEDYDFVLLDAIPSLGLMTLNVLLIYPQNPDAYLCCRYENVEFKGRHIHPME
ncbi:ParA family protein [Vallitalea maricola]|uniref:Uncharacterized protein n=1 Tax=Vallitalea maricola TaxID=3074433 RepID=A0ACB5UHR3_9FIRM|nr:hypothetical protein AN2V17_13300 [Vallitalea sp. AN17-2]